MAARLLAFEVADLCLGKPPLRALPVSATVGDALAALKSADDNFVSVWNCDHSKRDLNASDENCVCIGKICMVDIICYLCKEENLSSPALSLKSPVSVLLSNVKGLVRHVEASSSLLEAIDLILQGAQNLVVPIKSNTGNSKRRQLLKSSSLSPTVHSGLEFCWLTQEDIMRFFLSSIGLFSPIPTLSIDTLGIISTKFLAVGYHSLASSAIGAISQATVDQTSVAVVDDDGTLIGEISPFALACCDETMAAAITTLSAGDIMTYIDCGGPPEEIARMVEARLKERNLEGMLEKFVIESSSSRILSSSSSDEELPSPTRTPHEASDFGSWRNLLNTEFELERPLQLKDNLNPHLKKLLNGSGLNLSTHAPSHITTERMDLLRVCNKSRKTFPQQGNDDDCCLPNDSLSEKVLDIHMIEPPWLSEFSGVMRSAYGPVTAAKTIYEDDEGFLIVVSMPFADLQRVKVTWRNTLAHGIVKISCVSTGCMPIIKRQDRTFRLTDPAPEHCPQGEFIREISLPTRIPEDAKLEAYGDSTGTMLEILVPKHRAGPEEHEVRVCLRPSPWSERTYVDLTEALV